MNHILSKIVAQKRAEVARRKVRLPETMLARLVSAAPTVRPFAAVLEGAGPRLIAEIKRASPAKGPLRHEPVWAWDPVAVARSYEAAGAKALSVLTNGPFFWGSDDTLVTVRESVALPVLRKEFVVDPYQVLESRWLGADAVLLIVAALEPDVLRDCASRAMDLGMDVLVEAHADDEVEIASSVERAVVGINHRDLDTLELDMERAVRLRPAVPAGRVLVAESGLRSRDDLVRLMDAGIHAFLVGEALMAQPDPGRALRALLQ